MIDDNEKVNEKIEELIKHFENYIGSMNNRLKINSLFNEFEDKAREDLISLVKLSNTRYKGVKSGNSIQSVLEKQSQSYRSIIANAFKDGFYKTNDIYNEKQKFKNMSNKSMNHQIYTLRNKIKENTKSFNTDDGGNPYEQGGKYREANLKFLKRMKEVKSPTREEMTSSKWGKNIINNKKRSMPKSISQKVEKSLRTTETEFLSEERENKVDIRKCKLANIDLLFWT